MLHGRKPAFRGTDLVRGRRVKITGAPANYTLGATVGYADADDANWIGVTETDAEGEEPITVDLRAEPQLVEVSGAIAAGALGYAAANGRVDAAGTVVTHVILEASTAAGDHVSAIPV